MLIHIFNALIFIVLLCIIIYLINKNAYCKLSKSEYKYVIDKLMRTPYSVCLVDLYTNKLTIVNESFAKMLGGEPNDFNSMSILDLNLFNSYEEYIKIKKDCQCEDNKNKYTVITNIINNKKYIYKISYNFITIGFKKYLMMSVEDKTNMIEYIKRIGLFTKIADNTKDGIIVVNFKDGYDAPYIKYANDNIKEITGYKVTEIINKPLAILFESNVKEETLLDLYENLKKQNTASLEYQYIKRDGTICWIKTDMVPIIRESIIDKLIENDIDNELEGLENILTASDFEVYITLYQTDITENKQNYELPIKAYMNKVSEYDRSVEKFFNVIEGLLNMPVIYDTNYKSEMIKQITSIVGQASDSDKCYIYKIIDDKMKLQYIWRSEDFELRNFNVIENMTFEEAGLFKLYSNLIMNKHLYLNEETIKNNVYAKELFRMNEIKSSLIYPIMKNNKLIGFIGINSSENKMWNDNVNKLMKMVGSKLSNII